MKSLLFSAFAATTLVALGLAQPVSAHGIDHGSEVASNDETKVSIAAQKLNETLTMLYGEGGFTGGNVVVSNGPDGMLIIDNKTPEMSGKLSEALNRISSTESLRFILNTHWHFDHAGGNAEFGKVATIIAHANVRQRLTEPQKIDIFDMSFDASPKSALPIITYNSTMSVHFNGEEIQLYHMPASHTDTDTVVFFSRSKVLHTGDLFFNGLFPFVDIQNGGDVQNMAHNVEVMINTFPADTTIVPGHGPLATMDDLKTFHRMMRETIANVQDMIDSGKSVDDIKAAGVPEKWKGYTWVLDAATWNGIIHDSLQP